MGKPTHRGKRNHRKINNLKILTINVRGIKSKLDSLEKTLHTLGTHIAGITETHLARGETINIPGYEWRGKERNNKEGGGIGFLIRKVIINITEDIEDLNPQSETKWIKLKTKKPINIAIMYGQQENTPINQITTQFQELTTNTNRNQVNNEVIIMGDLNAKINIQTNKHTQETSRNGKLLEEFLKQTNTTATNTLPLHTGTWTRENRNNNNEKSVIDYILISNNLINKITESTTDDTSIFPIEGKHRTDHNIITTTINIQEQLISKTIKRWKKGSTQDWENYNKELKNIWDKTTPSDRTYNTLENAIIKSLESTVGSININANKKQKITNDAIKTAKRTRKSLKKEYEEACKNKTPRDINETKDKYKKSQLTTKEAIEAEINKRTKHNIDKLINQGGTNSNMFWAMRKRLMGKGNQEEYDTITEENVTITDPDQAKKHIADYFENLYQAREGEMSHAEWTKNIDNKIDQITNMKYEQTHQEITQSEINKNIKTIQRGKSTGPDRIPNEAIIEANQHNRNIIRTILNKIYNNEKIPDQWQEGEIIRFYKGKGKKGKCSNERGITLASNMGKLFERIINNRITKTVDITEAQAGGQKGKSTADHLLILNTIIKHHKSTHKNQDLHIAFLDVTKAYDKAWLNAILYALNKSGLKEKEWNLVKNINKKRKNQQPNSEKPDQ